jgi:hypothetical protein
MGGGSHLHQRTTSSGSPKKAKKKSKNRGKERTSRGRVTCIASRGGVPLGWGLGGGGGGGDRGAGVGMAARGSRPHDSCIEVMEFLKPSVMAWRIFAVPMPERCFASASASAAFTDKIFSACILSEEKMKGNTKKD